MTTHGAGEVIVPTGESTLADREMIIVSGRNGMYQIKTAGGGVSPFENENFTSLAHAKRAVSGYLANNAVDLNKKRGMKEAIERRQRAAELKNGELTETVNGPKEG